MSANAVEQDFIKYKESLNNQIIENFDENIKNLQRQSMAIYSNLNDILYLLNTPIENLDATYPQITARVNNYFRSILEANDKIFGISLISLDGEIRQYLNKQTNSINLYTVQNEDWFKNTLSLNGFPLLLEPHFNAFVNKGNNNKVISISRAIIDLDNNKINGILLVDQDMGQFSGILNKINTELGEIITIFGKSGEIVYTTQNINKDIQNKLFSMSTSQASNSFRFLLNGNIMLVTFAESKEYGWKVVSLLPISQLQAKSLFLKNINISLFIVLIVFTFIVSILVSYFITIPLKKLMASFKQLQNGNFDTSVTVSGKDEIAQIGLTFNSMVKNMKDLIKQKYNMNILRKQAELESLQSQINPHFLYNTLNSIIIVSEKQDFKKIRLMVHSMSNIFRYSLNRGKYVVKFSEELEHIKEYLYIQECRFTGKYEVIFDIENQVMDFDILRLTLQPIIENAIYHGLESKIGKGELHVTAKAIGDKYYIYISNNGINIPEAELVRINTLLQENTESLQKMTSNKIGIFNVNARIKFHFGDEYGLKIFSVPDSYTTVKITLPICDE